MYVVHSTALCLSHLLLPSGQKLVLQLLATITLELVPFHACAPFPALMPVSEMNPGSLVL
jgi:hypothetical protein